MTTNLQSGTEGAARLRGANARTALILAAIALVFFVGIIATEYVGGPLVAIGVIGSAALLFLILAIGRNLRQ
jgi:hypothetical protein